MGWVAAGAFLVTFERSWSVKSMGWIRASHMVHIKGYLSSWDTRSSLQ